jgi:hypothetical protein
MLLAPTSDGTHSFTTGDFQNAASSNIATNATTVYQSLDEVPAVNTDFVKQVVINSVGYVEVGFEDLPTTLIGEPDYVQLVVALHPVGSNAANSSAFRLNDGGTVTAEAVLDHSVTSDTLEFSRHGYQVRPNGGGAWDTASVNALKAQWGFGGDVTPPPALDAIYLEVVAPVTAAAASSTLSHASGGVS